MALVIRVLGGQGVFFFFVAPFCSCPASLVSRKFFAVGPGCAKCVFFVALRWAPRPFGGARQKKKHHPGCFFFCSGPGERQEKEKPRWKPARGQSKKKNTLGGVFFAAAPRGRSLTHCGPGWRCLPSRGRCFFFCCGPARTGVVFFFLLWPCPDAHSLTVGWAISARPGWCFFFLLRPRRVFLDNSKKCLGYYIGSKKTRRGHSKKKKTPLPVLG